MKTKLIQKNYKVFEGRYNTQIPLLVQKGLQPLTVKDVMQYRLQALQSKDKNEIDFWLNQYWDTITGLAYHDGKLIVVPNSQELLNINPDSKLYNGSLMLSKEQFEDLSKKHEVIKRSKVKTGKSLTKQEAKSDPIWIQLAQEDKHLLNEYTDAISTKAKEVYNYDENMGIYLPNDQENPVMRDWFLRGLYGRSYADTWDNLDYDDARLLGVRAQNLEAKIMELRK